MKRAWSYSHPHLYQVLRFYIIYTVFAVSISIAASFPASRYILTYIDTVGNRQIKIQNYQVILIYESCILPLLSVMSQIHGKAPAA
jgi:choline-glycine betaine transporter